MRNRKNPWCTSRRLAVLVAVITVIALLPARARTGQAQEPPGGHDHYYIDVAVTDLTAQTSQWGERAKKTRRWREPANKGNLMVGMKWHVSTDTEYYTITLSAGVEIAIFNTKTKQSKTVQIPCGEPRKTPVLAPAQQQDIGKSTGARAETPFSCTRAEIQKKLRDAEEDLQEDEEILSTMEVGFTVFGKVVGDGYVRGAVVVSDTDEASISMVIGENGVGDAEWHGPR